MPVYLSEYAMASRWVFPRDRFVEYEKSDEVWARKLGYGHEEFIPGCYILTDPLTKRRSIVIHPTLYDAIKEFPQ